MSPVSLGLPHREPFLFLDEVIALEEGVRATATKTFDPSEPMFRGHFPGDPIVPGVILTEALAQLAGIAARCPEAGGFLLSAIRAMKFPSAARPGETITLEAAVSARIGSLVQCDVTASVEHRVVASGSVVLNAVKSPSPQGSPL